MMKVLVDYPDEEDEFVIVERMTGMLAAVRPTLEAKQLIGLRTECEKIYVDPALIRYAVRLVAATRDPGKFGIADTGKYIMYGASPRASIYLIVTARALAFVRGREYVLPEDVVDMAPDVIRHRLVLSYEALSDGIDGDMIVERVLNSIPAPEKVLQSHVEVGTET